MAFKHPLDPQTQWDAAAKLGKLVAMRLVETEDVIPLLIEASVAAGYSGSLGGLQSRLHGQVADNATYWRSQRDRAEFTIRRELEPMLARLAPADDILTAAYAVNERFESPLTTRETRAIAEEQVAATLTLIARAQAQHARTHRSKGGRRNAR